MPKRLPWTEAELARMKKLLESGLPRKVIAQRFGCNASTLHDLAVKHGWVKKPAGDAP